MSAAIKSSKPSAAKRATSKQAATKRAPNTSPAKTLKPKATSLKSGAKMASQVGTKSGPKAALQRKTTPPLSLDTAHNSASGARGVSSGGVSVDIPSPAEVLGHVSWLMMRSEAHRHVFVSDFEWLLVPPITLKQFRIYLKEETPFAFATWARLTAEAEARLLAGHRRLSPADWNGGDRLWLIDLIAPFGGMEGILRDLSEKVFSGTPFKALVPGDGGKGLRVMTVGGAPAQKSAVKNAAESKPVAPKMPPNARPNKTPVKTPSKTPAKANGGTR